MKRQLKEYIRVTGFGLALSLVLACHSSVHLNTPSSAPAVSLIPAKQALPTDVPRLHATVTAQPSAEAQHKHLQFKITYQAPEKSFKTQALNCSQIAFLKLSVSGLNIPAPLIPTGVDADQMIPAGGACSFFVTIPNVPFGAARIATIIAYTAGKVEVPGSTIQAAFEVNANPTEVAISYRTMPPAKVIESYLALPDPLMADFNASHMDMPKLQTLIDGITGTQGVHPNFLYTTHPALVDAAAVFADLQANNNDPTLLNPANPAYKTGGVGTVTVTLSGLNPGETVTLKVNDPSSVQLTDRTNGTFTIPNVLPGNWVLSFGDLINVKNPGQFNANVVTGNDFNVGNVALTSLLKWNYNTGNGNIAYSSPVLGADGTIYTGYYSGLRAINPDGTFKWDRGMEWGYASPAIGADGTIYMMSGNNLYATNPDGSAKWTTWVNGWSQHDGPAIGPDGTIYISTTDNQMHAVRPDGSVKWVQGTGSCPYYSSPVIGPTGIIYQSNACSSQLYAHDPENGNPLWIFSLNSGNYSTPAIGPDGTIYVTNQGNQLYAVNPDGTQKWVFSLVGNGYWASPAVGADGTIYAAGHDGPRTLYAVNPNGTQKWAHDLNGWLGQHGITVGADDTIYAGTDNSTLLALNPDGSELFTFSSGNGIYSTANIAPDGTLYFNNSSGNVSALNTNSLGLANSSWPKGWGQNSRGTNYLSQILFESNRDGNPEIYRMPLTGTNQTNMTNNPANDTPAEPSPTRSKVAFTTDRDGNEEVYTMSADGSNPVNLTNHPARDQDPMWSSDSTRIAFQSDRDANGEVYIMNVDGSGQTNLSNDPAYDSIMGWSSDGTKIVFFTNRDGNGEIYVMNPDGSGQTNLSNNPANDVDPGWSPDGARLAFKTNRDGNDEIYAMNPDGSGQTNLSNNLAAESEIMWSPDSQKILFVSNRDGNDEIYIMNADGSGQTNLSNNAATEDRAWWSPDGTQIVFESNRDGNDELYRINADGTNLVRLTNNGGADTSPIW